MPSIVTVEVQKLEVKAFAADILFDVVRDQIQISEQQFLYHMRRMQDLGRNRVFGRCPKPWGCDAYRTCTLTDCTKGDQ